MFHIFAIVLYAVFSAATVHGATMDEAVQIALKNNTELQALRIEEEVAKAQFQKAKLFFPSNPNIEGSTSKKDKPIEAGGGKYTNYGAKLTQEFEIAGQRGLRIDIATKNLSKVGFEIRDKERTLGYNVKDAFARSLSLTKRKELTEKVVGIQEELLHFTKIRYRAGSVSGLEVNLAEIELGKAKRDLISVERELKESIITLQGLIGTKPDAGFTVAGDLSPDKYSLPDKKLLKERTILQRPDIKAALLEIEKSEKAVDLVKREMIPNINFGGFYIRDENRNERGGLISISIPLFDRKQSERRIADSRVSQARIKRAGLEKTLDKEIEEAYSNLVFSLDELDLFKKEIITKSFDTLNLLNFAFKEGKISFFEVRTAQKDTLEMQFIYLDTTLQAQRWIHALERAAGGNL